MFMHKYDTHALSMLPHEREEELGHAAVREVVEERSRK